MRELSSRYQILEQLGQGGMGEVYLARDLTLDRKVALKFLPKEKRQSEGSYDRILHEAKAAAALDHPYICKIYEVSHSDDSDFIVMEYLEGTTLRAKLTAGPLSLHDAIAYSCEIAEALEHAHAKGVIHRDLKPANIMLTSTGHIKILDFGLARRIPIPQDGKTPDLTTSFYPLPPGLAIGTPTYMSPEQVMSKPADCRSDIFSFGIVLYEMLTGIHPFLRPDLQGTNRAILSENPTSLSPQRSEFPELLAHVLRKMLAKAPEQRYQSAHEIFTDLRELREPDSNDWSGTHSLGGTRHRSLFGALVWGLVLLAAVLFTYWLMQRRQPAEAPPTEEVLIDWPSNEGEAKISPDGQWFSFLSYQGGNTTLWKKNFSAPAPEIVPTSGQPVSHAWSGDSRTLVCWVQDGTRGRLETIPSLYRDQPKLLVSLDDMEDNARSDLSETTPYILSWIDSRIYLKGRNNAWVVDQKTKTVQPLFRAPVPSMKGLCIRGDEKKIVYALQDDIWTADLDGGNPQRLTDKNWWNFRPYWIRKGGEWRIVYSSNQRGQLDLWELNPGKPSPRLLSSRGYEEIRVEDCSQDGSKILCQVIKDEANLWCHDPFANRLLQVTTGALSDFAPTIALSSRRLAFQRIKQRLIQGSRLVDTEIYSADLDKLPLENPQRILEEGSSPHLSPDGRWLAYFTRRSGRNSVELRLREISTQKEFTVSGRILIQVSDVPMEWMGNVVWSENSSNLFFVEMGDHDRMALMMYSPIAGAARPPAAKKIVEGDATARIFDPRPARDGKNLAYCLMKPGTTPTWEIRQLDLSSEQDRALFSDSGFRGRLYCLGWQDSSVIALRNFLPDRRGDNSGKLQVLKIGPDGLWKQIVQLDRAYGQTAVLDAEGQNLYVTTLENDISNIVACHLSSGRVRRLTDNQRADITFSGFQAGPADRLFFSQQKHVSDIYLLKFEDR